MRKKIVIVTGCSGFIGSHLVEFLIKKNKFVIGLDNLSSGNKKFMENIDKKNFKFYKVDLYKKKLINILKMFQKYTICLLMLMLGMELNIEIEI